MADLLFDRFGLSSFAHIAIKNRFYQLKAQPEVKKLKIPGTAIRLFSNSDVLDTPERTVFL